MKKFLFYTACNEAYEHFIPLYIYFTLTNNRNSAVEIGVLNKERYIKENKLLLNELHALFGDDFFISEANNPKPKFLPNAIRFINQPKTRAEYVYIGDIDILILEKDICEMHLKQMEKSSQPFSNKRRLNSKENRLTGLHFCSYDIMYPLPEIDPEWRLLNDEVMLWKIMDNKGYMVSDSYQFRPVHGIHISPSRHPVGELGWGVTEKRMIEYKAIRNDPNFQKVLESSDMNTKNIIYILDNVCEGTYDNLAKMIFSQHEKFFRKKKISRT